MHESVKTDLEKGMGQVMTEKNLLEKFERSKILEVYFDRLQGTSSDAVPVDEFDLYNVEISSLKNYLQEQHPQDQLFNRFMNLMH